MSSSQAAKKVTVDKPLKIYVAGIYTCGWSKASPHDITRLAHQRLQRTIRDGVKLIEKGHYPFVPLLTHYLHLEADRDFGEWYYEYDNAWLDECDAVFVSSYHPESIGVNAEIERAKAQSKPVWFDLTEVPEVLKQ